MSELIRLSTPDWRRPFTFPYQRDGQNPLLVRVAPTQKGFRIFCDGLVFTETELAVIVYSRLGLNCQEIGKRIERSKQRVKAAMEQAKSRNHAESRAELIDRAQDMGILDSDFFSELEKASDRNFGNGHI